MDEVIILSAFGGIPLVRYNFHDNGKVQTHQDIEDILHKKMPNNLWKIPFLSVFGKSDQTVSFYGLQIYPEHVREGLEHENIAAFVTGRFIMRPYTDKDQNQHWELYIELRQDVKETPVIRGTIEEYVLQALLSRNIEYNRLTESIGEKACHEIVFRDKGDPKSFGEQYVKQRWTQKE